MINKNPIIRVRKSVFVAGLFLWATLQAVAVEHGFDGQTLEDFLRQAQDANPKIQVFKYRYEAALSRIGQAGALPDPMLQITHFVESIQTRSGPQENVVVIGQRFPWFGKLNSRKQLASTEAEAMQYVYQDQQLILAKTISIKYYEYAYIGRAIDITRKNLELLEQLEPIVEDKVKSGADLNELLRLKVEMGKVADKLDSLKSKSLTLSASLSELLALPTQQIFSLPTWEAPLFEKLNKHEVWDAIQANNLTLQVLLLNINSTETQREIARLASYPDITLGLNYMQIGEPTTSPPIDAGKDAWGLTLSFNLPIWLEKNKATREESLNRQLAAEKIYQSQINTLKSDLTSSLTMLEDASRRLKLYGEDLLDLAKLAVENTRTSYEGGRTGILEVIDSERSLLDLQLQYWRAAADAWQQRIIIQVLANQYIHQDL